MQKKEKELFKQLCSFRSDRFDKELLQHASPAVLGHLFFNRMQGAAYSVLKKNECLGAVNREFRNSLKGAYEQNVERNRSFFQCVRLLSGLLAQCGCSAAMLKGALLCRLYPEGCRTANDIDLLVHPRDVGLLGRALSEAGFRQGNIRNGAFIPAARREIIESKLTRGETVPYILEIGLPYMRFLEVDINFSLDYKNSAPDVLERMLNDTVVNEGIVTLNRSDFLIHLACHLYKEAATLPWVKMKRDMTLYKYADLYLLLDRMSDSEISEFFRRAEERGLGKICAFTVLQTAELFDLKAPALLTQAKEALLEEKDFLHRVVSPGEKKTYLYRTRDITERFFLDDRVSDLREEDGR